MIDLDLTLLEGGAELKTVVLPFLIRCGTAAVCGGLIGIERETKRKPAGLRTNLLICVGSAMYMLTGLFVVGASGSGDATRIAAQVVTGIGFLGAGSIIQQGAQVTGLTSAATIWVVAAIGIVSGAGYPLLAFIATGMVILTLYVLGKIERKWFPNPEREP
jgi:putative Mg2+ transporter-C (MgtC) family protein